MDHPAALSMSVISTMVISKNFVGHMDGGGYDKVW